MSTKTSIPAKIIRVVTVPPVLLTILILLLWIGREDIFHSGAEAWLSWLLLGGIPLLAYPLQPMLPGFRKQGREGQRRLAFLLNAVGYTSAMIIGYVMNLSKHLKLIFATYFLSLVILIICNLLHIRASGHACGVSGPLVLLVYFIGWKALIPCLAVGAAVVWSSLTLKRHTGRDLLLGALACAAGFGLAWCLV